MVLSLNELHAIEITSHIPDVYINIVDCAFRYVPFWVHSSSAASNNRDNIYAKNDVDFFHSCVINETKEYRKMNLNAFEKRVSRVNNNHRIRRPSYDRKRVKIRR